MFVLTLRLLAISFVFHFYKNRYPNEYNAFSKQIFDYIENNERLKPIMPYLLKVGYAFIYAYSFCQILLNKVIQITSPYVKMLRDKIMPCKMSATCNTTNSNSNSKKTIVSFYNDGLLVKKDEFTDFNADIKNSQPIDAFNLVTITDASNCDGVRNILTFIPDECKYDLLDLRFLALYLKHDDKSHIIDLYQDNSNYYVAGNVINSAFLKYYLKNVLSVVIDNSKPFVYTLELMDHNVQMVYLNEMQSIVFQKDGYIIEDGPKVLSAAAEETKAEETKAEETKAEETKAEETKAEETKAEETKTEETKAEETKAEEDEDYDDLPELIDIIEKVEESIVTESIVTEEKEKLE
jgi:hypothetical protein